MEDSDSHEYHQGLHHPLPRLTKYGATREPPRDDSETYPTDDTHSFFAKGRDFEGINVNHQYTDDEKHILSSYESLDYLASHSHVYKNWIRQQPQRASWDYWVMMALIGFSVGLLGFFLHQIIDLIAEKKWEIANDFILDHGLVIGWLWVLGYSVLFVLISSSLVVYVRPSAGGSGLPELIGFLNGTVVRHIFNVKTLCVKFISCCCAVGSGLPVGPEGPMIHLGSLVGAGLSQFKSDTLKFSMPFFERFRNSEDRRNFISAGAAAGVASAFGAPVGGLLFSMEEVSSFWNQKLSWQIFFCAMIATFTTDLLNSAFMSFKYQGQFGMFKAEKYILFQVTNGISVNILAFIPAALLGVIGGLLGALFNFLNLKIVRFRKRMLAKISAQWKRSLVRTGEPMIIMVLVATVTVFFPAAFGCSQFMCEHSGQHGVSHNCLSGKEGGIHVESSVEPYQCPHGVIQERENYTWTNKTYNQMATLLFTTGEGAIHHLFSRTTHLQFHWGPLMALLPYYFLVVCWAAGTSISSGLVVPMLLVGGIYGRIVGIAMVGIFDETTDPTSYWVWVDPGAFALIGAASFFGGVSRLTMSLTVIMMEMTNDVQFLLPIMAAIMIAKWVGDFFTHPLYHALLELKCIPFLDAEPVITLKDKRRLNLELYTAGSVMTPTPVVVKVNECISRLAYILLSTSHGGFPVVVEKNDKQVFYGFINRLELAVLLKYEDLFIRQQDIVADTTISPEHGDVFPIDYQMLTLDKLSNPREMETMLQKYCDNERYNDLYFNLEPYINQSAVSIQEKFSLHRTYILFRTLGMRHLTIVDHNNHVQGIITRKDLMGFNMEMKLLSDGMDGGASQWNPQSQELNIQGVDLQENRNGVSDEGRSGGAQGSSRDSQSLDKNHTMGYVC